MKKCDECSKEKIELNEGNMCDGCSSFKKKKDSVSRIDYNSGDGSYPWMVEKMEKTPEGYMKGRAIITNVGVFSYMLPGGKVRRELRPPEEVFAEDSLMSLNALPLTNGHPNEAVNSENIKKYQVGFIGDRVDRDPFHVSNSIVITHPDAIQSVQEGRTALSAGYEAELEETPGVWMGITYDAIQRNIRYNHVALVDEARAGDAARLKLDGLTQADAVGVQLQPKGDNMSTLKKVTLDGVEYDAEAKVIESLHGATAKLDASEKQIGELKSETEKLKKDQSALTAERDQLKEELETLKKSTLKADEIEKAVKAKLELISSAQKSGVEVKADMSDAEIKKAVILSVFPSAKEKLDSCDDVYLNARFDGAMELINDRAQNDEQKAQIIAGVIPGEKKNDASDSAKAREKMIADLQNSYKGE